MITVSVIVTFYNQENYVDTAMQCIFGQKTDFDFDVIVGDDGSSDRTMEKVQSWIDRYPGRIRAFVRSREDGVTVPGFRASRNRLSLLEQADGKYFIFLDGDDYFTDANKLQKQVEILEREENRDCVACSHYIEALYPDGHKVSLPVQQLSEGKYDLKRYWTHLYFHTDTTLVRSSVIAKLPKDIVINNFNDNMITFLLLLQGSIYFIPEKMAVYLQTGDGIWTSRKALVNHIRNLFLCDLCELLAPDAVRESEIRLSPSWKYLYKHRDKINKSELEPFVREAEERSLRWSLLFLNYRYLSRAERNELRSKANSVFRRSFANRVKRKLSRG